MKFGRDASDTRLLPLRYLGEKSRKKLIALAMIASLLAVGTAAALVVVEVHKVADVFFTIPEEQGEITSVYIDLGELRAGDYFNVEGRALVEVREQGWKARFYAAPESDEVREVFDWCFIDILYEGYELWGTIDFSDPQSCVEVELPEGSYYVAVCVYGEVSDDPLAGSYEFVVSAGVWKPSLP